MSGANLTVTLLAIALTLSGMYDLLAWLAWGYPATVTAVVRELSMRWPLIPFGVGVLIGHLFAF